jgi:alpha-L-fucosidase 2
MSLPDNLSVTWTTPSADSSGSMPLGNGDIGLNVWCEPNGDLLFYISKTDAWSEIARLLKLGRIRVRTGVAAIESFRQTLNVARGSVDIQLNDVALSVWVDANHPVIHVQVDSPAPLAIEASVEIWRTAERAIQGDELFSAYDMVDAPHPVVESGDCVLTEPLPGRPASVAWYHRNPASIWPESMTLQGLAELMPQLGDPLLNHTFGAALTGENLLRASDTVLRSASPATHHTLALHVLAAQTDTVADWQRQLEQQIAQVESIFFAQRRTAHAAWWQAFWDRSHIAVTGNAAGSAAADAVTRGYGLQRFVTACAGRGAYPIKFNGSLFTVEPREPDATGTPRLYNPDYRAWGGPYWFQNTRLPYWPMLAAGDYDLLQPLFRMYRTALPLLKARTRLYFNHDGAYFPETMSFWGTYASTNYGWKRDGKPANQIDNPYIGRYYSCGLELLALMLDAFEHTCDESFGRDELVPWATEILAFYAGHFGRDTQGKLDMQPAQALETWQVARNPAPDIAGLQFVLDRLLALAGESIISVPQPQLDAWARLWDEVPDLPMKIESGQILLDVAAQVYQEAHNVENAELYAIFPFRLFGANMPDLDVARATFERRRFRHNRGWCQDSIQAAYLGLAAEARRMLVQRFSTHHERSRFPAFWGPNFDWMPDQCHGGGSMLTLQTMLMQCSGEHIFLFPAWPAEWDVDFKLHAPLGTVVEGVYRQGKLQALAVTPESRREDVVVMEPQA